MTSHLKNPALSKTSFFYREKTLKLIHYTVNFLSGSKARGMVRVKTVQNCLQGFLGDH